MKKKFLSVALASMMVVSNIVPVLAEEPQKVDLTDGLIAEYLFDGDWKDSLSSKVAENYSAWGDYWLKEDPNVHPGALLKSDSTRGNVAEMNGMWNNTGYLSFDTSYLKELTNAFSVTMWAKGNNSKTVNSECADSMSIFNIRTKEKVDTADMGFVSLDTRLYPFINDGMGNYMDPKSSDLALSTTDWMQVTMVIDAENNCVSTYVNGVLRDSDALGGGTVSNLMENIKNAYALQIGSYTPWWEVWDFRGYVDDVRFYNKALSAEDVAALYTVAPDKSLVEGSEDVTSDVTTYAQYKKVAEDNYTVRVVSEVAISESEIDTLNRVGFRCSRTASNAGDKYLGKNIYKAIKANGETKTAADGKYFVVLEITNVKSDAILYVQPLSEKSSAVDSFGKEVTVNMKNILK